MDNKQCRWVNNLINPVIYDMFWRNMAMIRKKFNKPWLYFGVVSGFLCGFCYFAYGVYIHGNSKRVGPSSSYHNHAAINL